MCNSCPSILITHSRINLVATTLFPGLPQLQFLIVCSMKNCTVLKAWECGYHWYVVVIHCSCEASTALRTIVTLLQMF